MNETEVKVFNTIIYVLSTSGYISEAYLMRKCKITFGEARKYIDKYTEEVV